MSRAPLYAPGMVEEYAPGKYRLRKLAQATGPAAPVADQPRIVEDRTRLPKQPNATEARYAARVLAGRDARYEAITFRLANSHKYTPDFVVVEDGMPVECHECKGSYKLGSYQRARMAFDQAHIEWPGIRWVWAEETKGTQ